MEGFDAATYGDRFADVYDDWYPADDDTAACVARLAALAGERPGSAVLELAVGTGRVAVPLAAAGVDVRGIDASPAMLERLAAKAGGGAVCTEVADMTTPVVPRRASDGAAPVEVGLAFVTANTLFALPGPAARRSCFSTLAVILAAAHGRFALDAFVPPDPGEGTDGDAAVTIRSLTADRVVLSAARRDRAARTITGQFIDLHHDGGVRLRPYHLHYASPADLDAELGDAGFRLVERWADWRGTPYAADADHHVSVYEV